MQIILTTVPKKSHATMLARQLVGEKLAGCVNIIPLSSIYRWKGNVKRTREWLLLIKTGVPYTKAERVILKHHPYEMPEIIALPIAKGYKKYLDWIARPR